MPESDPIKRKLTKKERRNLRRQKRKEQGNSVPSGFVRPKYDAYIRSPLWFKFRQSKIDSVGGKCEECGSADRLQVHHLHYKTLGMESFADVQVLCKACHRTRHPKYAAITSNLVVRKETRVEKKSKNVPYECMDCKEISQHEPRSVRAGSSINAHCQKCGSTFLVPSTKAGIKIEMKRKSTGFASVWTMPRQKTVRVDNRKRDSNTASAS